VTLNGNCTAHKPSGTFGAANQFARFVTRHKSIRGYRQRYDIRRRRDYFGARQFRARGL